MGKGRMGDEEGETGDGEGEDERELRAEDGWRTQGVEVSGDGRIAAQKVIDPCLCDEIWRSKCVFLFPSPCVS